MGEHILLAILMNLTSPPRDQRSSGWLIEMPVRYQLNVAPGDMTNTTEEYQNVTSVTSAIPTLIMTDYTYFLIETLMLTETRRKASMLSLFFTRWRHQMETFSALLVICAGNSPVTVNSLYKGQWHRALMFSLICAWINGWINSGEAGD